MSIVRRKTEVEISLTRSSGRDHPWTLRITDRRSGVEIIQVHMGNDTFADMMSSTMAGNLAQAEVALVPWIGKYAVRHSEVVDTRGIDYHQLPDWLREQGALLAKDLGQGWHFTGYQGGGGGSMTRTLTFVKYVDEKPEGS